MFTKPNRLLTLSALLGLSAVAMGAQASNAAPAAPSVVVSYRDLDLSRPGDVRTLYRRLQHAAASVCVPVSQLELSRYMAWQRCYNSALDSAVMAVRSPELLALNDSAHSSAAKHG
jgi:UrcA family protein